MSAPSLEHHGVKGMKWGVRRYQNADGTLTAAGKNHAKILRTRSSVQELVDTTGLPIEVILLLSH